MKFHSWEARPASEHGIPRIGTAPGECFAYPNSSIRPRSLGEPPAAGGAIVPQPDALRNEAALLTPHGRSYDIRDGATHLESPGSRRHPANANVARPAVLTIPSRTSSLATVLVGLGLLTCIYLSALKLLNVPCPLTGCGDIINSRYGSVLGVPLPLVAVPLWTALAFPATRAWQNAVQLGCVLLLALGGLMLMGIQFLVLRGFCPFCTLHAAAALAAAFALPMRGRAHPWLPSLMLALALPVILATKELALAQVHSWDSEGYASVMIPKAPRDSRASRPVNASASSMVSLQATVDQAAFSWLGAIDSERSPVLVISFQCPHCLDLLGQCLKHPQFGTLKGPKVLLFSSSDNSADSIAVLAAILSVPGTPQQQFTTVFSQLGMLFDPLLTRDSKELRSRLGALFPSYTAKLAAAREQLNAQSEALKYIPGHGTPFLLQANGSGKYDVTPEDVLFP